MTDYIHVLWLTPNKPDNISVGRKRIAERLEERGFDVTLRGTTVRTILTSAREIGQYDAIIGTTRAGALAGTLLKFAHRCPLVVDHIDPIRQFEETHGKWLSGLVRVLENVSFRAADSVLYVYEEESERVTRYAKDIEPTDLGVEFERFSNPSSDVVTAAQEHLAEVEVGEDIVIYVGGLEPIYNIETMIDAMEYIPDWSLVIIGDGSLRESVTEAARKHENVHYLGTVPHEMIPGYLQTADVGISLVDDPHTLKVLEYGAAGLPVVQATGRAKDRFGERLQYAPLTPRRIAAAIKRADERGGQLQSFVAAFDWAKIADDYERSLKSNI